MLESVSSIRSQYPPTTPTQPPHSLLVWMMWYSIWNTEISIMLMTGCNQLYFWSVCAEHFGLSINEKNIDFYMDKPPSWKNFIDIYGPFNFPTYDESKLGQHCGFGSAMRGVFKPFLTISIFHIPPWNSSEETWLTVLS